jgi:glycosyltransferase involved in cell wall biosynthesis
MRVLHVLTSIDPTLGGTVEAARHMAGGMSRCGVQTEVLSLVTPSQELLDSWPVKVHGLGKTTSYYHYSRHLVPWIRENHHRYDAIVVHGVWRHPSFGVWLALRRASTPYFLFTHGMLDPWFQRTYPQKHLKKTLFWRLAEHRVLADARAVLFASEDEKRLAAISFRPYRCREHVVGLGTALPPGDTTNQIRDFHSQFPHLDGKRVLLFMGRLHRVKGCDLLIQAFAAVAGLDPRLHLVLAGPDEEDGQAELERLTATLQIADRVTFTGHLQGSLKWGAFRSAEVFTLPSHTESYGVAIVEAMACGIPVLITNRVNTWREIAGDAAGLVAADDLGGVCDLLRQWCMLDPERRKAFGANAYGCFRDRFEIGKFSDHFTKYLASELPANQGRINESSSTAERVSSFVG